jgi:tetratricopeptide (TPR) repeat protein
MKKYLLLVSLSLFLISCSKTSDQDYFDKSEKLLKESKISEAVDSYQRLLKEYPNSELAPKTLQRLASIYQNQMDKKVKPVESFELAQNYFYQSYEKNPDNPDAPKSLFLSGFILANDLHKYDEATSRLKLFLEKYPDNSLSNSVQMELDNMGLSPEEILKRTETAKK